MSFRVAIYLKSNVSLGKVVYAGINERARREGFSREGGSEAGAAAVSASLEPVLCFLSCRNKKGRPTAGDRKYRQAQIMIVACGNFPQSEKINMVKLPGGSEVLLTQRGDALHTRSGTAAIVLQQSR